MVCNKIKTASSIANTVSEQIRDQVVDKYRYPNLSRKFLEGQKLILKSVLDIRRIMENVEMRAEMIERKPNTTNNIVYIIIENKKENKYYGYENLIHKSSKFGPARNAICNWHF